MHGTMRPEGDRWVLEFTRHLAHPPEKVWRAITEPDHLRAWFPSTIEGERRAGAGLRFRFDPNSPDLPGEMLIFDPPKVMELRWGDDVLRFELTAVDGGTLLELRDTFVEQGKGARDAAGWHECLDLLAAALDGSPKPELGSRWAEVHPQYVEAFGPEASTIGPPEGHEPGGG